MIQWTTSVSVSVSVDTEYNLTMWLQNIPWLTALHRNTSSYHIKHIKHMKRNLRQCVHNRGRWPILSWPTHALQQPTGHLWWHHAILNLVCKQLTEAYPAERSCCQLRYIDWCCYINACEYHFSSYNNIYSKWGTTHYNITKYGLLWVLCAYMHCA